MTLNKKRKILVVSGTRAEYGYVRPLLKLIEDDPLVTNMHLLDKFGNSVREFEKDGIEVTYKIHNTLDGYTNVTMVKSLGIYLLQLPEILQKSKPDVVLISGDRGEQLMSVVPDFYVKDIRKKLGLRENKKIFLIVNHSITEESKEAGEQMKAIIDAVEDMDAEMILIMPNSDAGSAAIRKTLTTYGSDNLNKSKFDRFHIFYNLSRIH